MQEILQTTTAQVVIGLAGLAILGTIGGYIVLKFRDSNDSTESSTDLLTKFQEMRQEGHINEEEYRTIKTDLRGKLSLPSSDRKREDDGGFKDDRSQQESAEISFELIADPKRPYCVMESSSCRKRAFAARDFVWTGMPHGCRC